MKAPRAVLALFFAGCLPAYDNMYHAQISGGDMATTSDGMGDDGGMAAGSGKFVTGTMFSIDQELKASGPILHIDGYTDPQFVSMPADNTGRVKFEIPKSVYDSMTPLYLIVEGSFMGSPILRTTIAPPQVFNGGPRQTDFIFHFFQDQDKLPMGARNEIAKELAAHGDIPSAASFAKDYSFMYGLQVDFTPVGIVYYHGYSVGVDDLSNSSCKPSTQCCVYYTYRYSDFLSSVPPKPSLIEFSFTKSPAWFLVVCPASQTGDVTLKPLGDPRDQDGNAPGKPFPAIKSPRRPGEGVFVHWLPQQ